MAIEVLDGSGEEFAAAVLEDGPVVSVNVTFREDVLEQIDGFAENEWRRQGDVMKKVGCLTALLLLTGCVTAQERAEQMRPAMVAEDAPPAAPDRAARRAADNKLHCEVGHDRIEITIPAKFPPEIKSMAVIQNDKWRTIVDEENHLAPFRPGVRQLILRPSVQQAVDYRDGRKRRVKAFPTSGEYDIIFSDNLETEPENMLSVACEIRLP